MPAPVSSPAERLAEIQASSPEATELARALSLAVRAEPELVRRVRRTLFPASTARLEADLYFSPLVAQRPPDWIVLDPQFARELQRQVTPIADMPEPTRQRLRRVRRILRQAHAAIPSELACEEEVTWLAVEQDGGVESAKRAIDRALRSPLSILLRGSEASMAVARWFAAASHRMPPLTRETQAFELLAFTASSLLGGRRIPQRPEPTLSLFDFVGRYLPDSSARIPIWVALTTRGLRVTTSPADGYRRIDVPPTDPVLLDVRASDGGRRVVQITAPQSLVLPLPAGVVTVRTLVREVFRLHPRTVDADTGLPRRSPQAQTHTVFVSYAARDREWVRPFARDLEDQLRRMTGSRTISVWMDETSIPLGDSLSVATKAAVQQSTFFVPVVSPAYADSMSARRELEWFVTEAEGSAPSGGAPRVIPVYLGPLDHSVLPSAITDAQRVHFFREEFGADRFIQFDHSSAEYEEQLQKLAHIVKTAFRSLRHLSSVFVASTGDLDSRRDRLRNELMALGYAVVTEPEDVDSATAHVFMAGEVLSESIPDQLSQALARSGPQRVYVWVPRDVDLSVSQNRDWAREVAASGRAELIHASFQDLLDTVVSGLRTQSREQPQSESRPQAYIICTREDLAAVRALAQWLDRNRLSSATQLFDTDPVRMRTAHEEALQTCDGAIVYWGQAPLQWALSNIEMARRAFLVRGTQAAPLALYAAPPSRPEKLDAKKYWPGGLVVIHSEGSPVEAGKELVTLLAGGADSR